MNLINLMLLPGFLFLIVIGFGLLVSKFGKPYNYVLFNIHKLIALGAVVMTGIRIFKLDPFVNLPISAVLLIGLAVLGVIGLFATGAIMSIKETVPRAALLVHRIAPVFISLSLLAAILLTVTEQLRTL